MTIIKKSTALTLDAERPYPVCVVKISSRPWRWEKSYHHEYDFYTILEWYISLIVDEEFDRGISKSIERFIENRASAYTELVDGSMVDEKIKKLLDDGLTTVRSKARDDAKKVFDEMRLEIQFSDMHEGIEISYVNVSVEAFMVDFDVDAAVQHAFNKIIKLYVDAIQSQVTKMLVAVVHREQTEIWYADDEEDFINQVNELCKKDALDKSESVEMRMRVAKTRLCSLENAAAVEVKHVPDFNQVLAGFEFSQPKRLRKDPDVFNVTKPWVPTTAGDSYVN